MRAMGAGMRVVGNKKGEGSMAMAMATKMVGEWTTTATKRAIATATRVPGDKEGNGDGGKSNGDGNEGDG